MASVAGYGWLMQHYGVEPVQPLPVRSEIGGSRASHGGGKDADGRREVYPEAYRPEDSPAGHLAFALKREGVHLECLARLFRQPDWRLVLMQWLAREPSGAYVRRACFLYEWLMPEPLPVSGVSAGNYVDALDAGRCIVGQAVNRPRWRVRDNLPGTRDWCPSVRRVEAVQQAERYDFDAQLAGLEADFGIDLLQRSAVWLTVRESRASFLIEREQAREDRIRRFAAVMERDCGRLPEPLAPATLARLQRDILGDTALVYGVRRSPVYVGHPVRYEPVVDYIAPHWDEVPALLAGLATMLERTHAAAPIVRAALASFGFVYVHPMADGNGRISRFLINDVLRRDQALPAPLILPVSATITNSTRHRAAYDAVLERFSRPLMRAYADRYAFVETATASDGIEYNLQFDAYDDALPAWRYPDLTAHVIYLADLIDETLRVEMRTEAGFLRANDAARTAIKAFLEAPDPDLDGIIRSVRQNGHALSNALLKRYPLLAERPDVGERVIEAVRTAFAGK